MKLAHVFSDGAVFQRNLPIPVWGHTEPCCVVKASFAGETVYGKSSGEGRFMLSLPPTEAGGPYVLVLENTKTSEQIELHDILVGEVWLASGQSNMQFFIKDSPAQEDEFNKANRAPDLLRFLCVKPNPTGAHEKSFDGTWSDSEPEAIREMSAVALWHGLFLQKQLGIPVGIISSACGGTCIEAWTSRNTLLNNPEVAPELSSYETWLSSTLEPWDMPEAPPSHLNFFRRFGKLDTGNEGFGKGWAAPDFDDSEWRSFNIPGSWTASGLCGLGAVWFRRTVEIPRAWAGKKLLLCLGGVDKQDTSYFNGVEIGATGKGFEDACYNKPRQYQIPAKLVKPGRTTLAIRAYSFIYDGAFNGEAGLYSLRLVETSYDEAIPLDGEWKSCNEKDYGYCGFPQRRGSDMGPGNPSSFHILFDGNIRPLIPYSIRGVIWYQGEDNTMIEGEQPLYRRKLADLIKDWRFHWGQGDFPFYIVQLANFREGKSYDSQSAWAPLRESQRLACHDVPNTGLAVAIDIGEAGDIHPKNKRDVGKRLATLALRNVYGFSATPCCGPFVKSARHEGARIRISFEHTDGGLVFEGGIPRGFWVVDSFAKRAVEADHIQIEGDEIVVGSSQIRNPYKVRYAWADNPDGNLRNGAGFPASPFEA